MRKLILLSLAVHSLLTASAQDFSNKGKDFWVGYGYHTIMTGGNTQDMVLYFATDQVTNITITIPGLGYTQNLTSLAGNNVLTSAIIPKTFPDARLIAEGLSDKGIHITSDKPMVAYAHIYNQSVSGATILYPTNTLGKEYYSINYKNWSNSNNANSWFYVVATDTGTTTVEIKPTANTTGGWIAGNTYTVNLTKGQIYNVMGVLTGGGPIPGNPNNPYTAVDLTGSNIKSISTGSGCKRIAVFSGSGRISITCNANSSSSDNYMVQSVPKTAWGKKYLTVPASGNQDNNIYRVCKTDPTTVVMINGVVTPFVGFYYEIPQTNQPQLIEADKPIMVAQYFTSQNACANGGPGDPEVIYLSAVEQNINTVLWNATANFGIGTHYVNVVIPNAGTAISSFTFDGIATGGFILHPQDPKYSYLRLAVANGPHIIRSDSGFNAIAYGFGNFESYGYNAGTNIKDLYQQIRVSSTFGIETTPSVCTNSPFKFKVSLPYEPDSMYWNFYTAGGMMPNNNNVFVVVGPGAYDSTTIVNLKTIYWYSLPTQYNFTTVGTYPVTITTYSPDIEGCGSVQEIDFDLVVTAPPVPNFTWTAGRCVAEPFQFTETTPQIPKATYRWWWDFGDLASGAANNSIVRNPTHTFTNPGIYTVKYAAITTPGCLTDTVTQLVTVLPLPTAIIDGTNSVCVNAGMPSVVFTGSGGTAPYTFNYNINGVPQPPLNTVAGNTATILAPTITAGIFVYTLTSVNNTGSTLCSQVITGQQATVTINPLPTATISGTTAVCLNAPSPNITFTGASGTAPYTFSYTLNGGPVLTVTTVAGNSVTVAAPTNVAGTFTYALISVRDGSSTTCIQAQAGNSVITVNPLPTATITGTTAVCLNAPSPLITFTGAIGGAPYTFIYNINGGPNQTVSTIAGNTVTVAANTNVAGIFTYNLISVQDGSGTACIQAQTGSAIITVNALPTATITGSVTVCLNAPLPNITFTGANTLAPYTFTYTINGGPAQTVTTTSGNSITVPVPTNVAGTFTYTLISVQDGSGTACSQLQSGSATVIVKVLPTALIAGTTAVCLNAASPNITFTGANGTAPYTFTYTINAGPPQNVTTVAGNSVSVAAPTNVAGTFTYNLVSVQEGSPNLCSQVQTGTSVITVNQLPTATISGTTEVCLNSTSPNITFTGANTIAPYTFSYTINSGPVQTVTTVAGNSVTVPVLTNVAGTFTYSLVSVRDGSPTLCSQTQSGSAIVTVNPLPTPNFTFTIPGCETRVINFTDASVPNVGVLTNWTWNFGDGSPVDNNVNPAHIYSAAGIYNVTLSVTNSKGCISFPIANIPVTINDRPLAGFIIPEVCLSDTYAQFLDTSKVLNGTVNAWQWNFGDPLATPPGNPNTSTLQNPTHSYTAVGNYNVELITTSNSGCRDTIVQLLTVNGSFPVANFTVNNPATLCANDSVAIVNTSTVFPGSITKIEIYWDNAGFPAVFDTDNLPAAGKTYKHLYPNFQAPLTRVFTIRFRAYSGGICVNDRIANITVNAAPLVQFNTMPDACLLGAPFQITQASETGGVPGTGVFSGPGVSATGLFTAALAGIGTHTIKFTFTSTAGGCVDTMSNTIKVLDTASARFSYVSPICEGNAGTFTETSTAPASVSMTNTTWNFNDGSPLENHAPGSTFTHIFPAAGTYPVTMYNTSSFGCNSTVLTKPVTVSPRPVPNFGLDKPSYCIPNAVVSFNNTSFVADGSSMTYLWDFGDGSNTSTAFNPAPHWYIGTGPYNVNLKVTSGIGCIHDTTIIVNTIHPQPKAGFTINKPGICIGDDVTFTDNTDGKDGTVNQWHWVMGDGSIRTTGTVTYTYSNANTFNVVLYSVNSHGCNSDTVTKPFTVYPYPTVNAGPDRFILEGGSIVLQPVVTGNDLQFLWTPDLYFVDNKIEKARINRPLTDMTYTLTVTARGGCSFSDIVFVKLLKFPKIPNTFTPNNDGINDTWRIDYLNTYPDNRVQVFTRTGQLVFESRGYDTPWNGTIKGKPLPFDTYYYIIEPGNGRDPITGYVTIIK